MKPTKNSQLLFSIISFSTILSQFSTATDTLTTGQSLKDGQTLVSSGQIFELGFFSPGNSSNRYVGIWYHNITRSSPVWVANRQTPLTSSGGILTLQSDGNLVLLTDQGSIAWSTDTSISSNTFASAQILDSGRLIIRSSNKTEAWDSFDHPSDTFLPGMKLSLDRMTGKRTLFRSWKSLDDPSFGNYSLGLDPLGSGQLFMWKGRRPRWRSGQWDGTRFIGSTMRPLYLYGFKASVSEGSMSFTFTQFNSSLLKFALQWDGVENTSIFVQETQEWRSVWVQPVNQCETYGKCRDYGICSADDLPICRCLRGFEPRFSEEWSKRNWSGGCVRRTALQCEMMNSTNSTNASISSANGEGDGFYRMTAVKIPDFTAWMSTVVNEADCRSGCWTNCSCKAYAYVSGIGCLTWTRELIDIYQFPEGSGSDLYIKVAGSELGSKSKAWRTILIICASVILLLMICTLLLCWKFNAVIKGWFKKDKNQKSLGSRLHSIREGKLEFSEAAESGGEGGNDAELPLFSFDTMANATSNFSDSNKLGEGGFGHVYKGTLPGGKQVAAKRLSRSSGQGQEEFKNEMTLIAKLQHRNLVRLLGCCIQEEEKMLIYEYLPNKSLDAFIFDPSRQQLLDWNKRFNIIEGIARGLVYLHRDSRLRIVHRDLKASNVLLDEDMNPKISDFGMARIFGNDQNQLNTNRVVGTFGYMSPEYAMEGYFSAKSDVYSFGILVLEIISGRRNNSFHNMPNTINIVGYTWKLWDKDRAAEMIDPTILDSCSVHQVMRCVQIGLLCVQDRANDRPDMPSVVLMLGSENPMLPLPKAPLFTMEESPNDTRVMANMNRSHSVNDVTITELVPR